MKALLGLVILSLVFGTALGACNTLTLTNETNGTIVDIGSCYEVEYEVNGTQYTMTINNTYYNSTITPTECSVEDTINPGDSFVHNSTGCFVDIECDECDAMPEECTVSNHTVAIRFIKEDDGTIRIISPFQDELIGDSVTEHQWSWEFMCSDIVIPENLDVRTNKTYEECKSYFGNFSDTFVLALCMDEVSSCRENYGNCTFNYQSLLTDHSEQKEELALCSKDVELYAENLTQNALTISTLYGELNYTGEQAELTNQEYQDWAIFGIGITCAVIFGFMFWNYRREESVYG